MNARSLFGLIALLVIGGGAGCSTSQNRPSAITLPLSSPSLLFYSPLGTNAFSTSGGNPWSLLTNATSLPTNRPIVFYYGPVTTNGITIFTRPDDQIVPTNGLAHFAVAAEPVNPLDTLTFQWMQNGAALTNSTNMSLTISNCTTVNVGFYSCLVGLSGQTNSILVGSDNYEMPGAQLFVYWGTNTMIQGPYLPGTGSRSCVGPYVGSMTLLNPHTGNKLFMRPEGKTTGVLTDHTTFFFPSLVGSGYLSKVYYSETGFGGFGCNAGSLTFPALRYPPSAYVFSVYVTGGSLPLGTPLTLDTSWR